MSDSSVMNRTSPLASFVGRRWALLFLLFETVVFCVIADGFFTIHTFQLVFIAGMPLFLLAVAETFVIITGGIDLSVGFVFGFATVVSAKLVVAFQGIGMTDAEAVLAGCAATLVIGLLPGYINGWLVARLRVPPFIATYSMLSVSYGISELLVEGSQAGNLPYLVTVVGTSYFAYFVPGRGLSFFSHERVARGTQVISILPIMVVVVLVVILIFAFILRRTAFGQHTYAIGGNVDAAVRSGIGVKWHLERVYIISSFLATIAGITYMLQYAQGKSDAGASYLLDSIVAVVIGGASLYGGVGTIGGTLVGALLISVLETGLRVLGLPTFTIYVTVGVILIVAVLIDQFFPERTEGIR
ncbi:MAG TPA: ABC transporter permease [Spirochaetia bacterium]|nr:ABC transporter permease [Spirochaetia bacterium]